MARGGGGGRRRRDRHARRFPAQTEPQAARVDPAPPREEPRVGRVPHRDPHALRARGTAPRGDGDRRRHPTAAPRRKRGEDHDHPRGRRLHGRHRGERGHVQPVLPRDRTRRPRHPLRLAQPRLRPLPEAQPVVPREVHVRPCPVAAQQRRRGPRRAAQPGFCEPRERGAAHRRHLRGTARARLATRARGPRGVPDRNRAHVVVPREGGARVPRDA